MNEQQIVKDVVKEEPVKVDIPDPIEPKAEPTAHFELYPYLSIDGVNVSREDANKVKTIYEYVKAKSQNGLKSEILQTIRDLEIRLRTPKLGETRLDNLYRYIRIANMRREIDKEMEVYES